MNIYKLQKLNKLIKSRFIKNAGFWLLHVLNRRYLTIFFDPVLGCNLKCRSCYFSDEERRKELKGSFQPDDLPKIANSIFGRALKLQIGCGAEPTLYKHNAELIRLAKQHGVSYISMTTNANLLTEERIVELLAAGLNEFTISLHGVKKQTYEYLMTNADFDKLLSALEIMTRQKKNYPGFKVRLNYTINNKNLDELDQFFDILGNYEFDILQLRALRDIGGEIKSVETNLEFLDKLKKTTLHLKSICEKSGIVYIGPDSFTEAVSNDYSESSAPSYCYISPKTVWETDFDWKNETFDQYSRRKNYGFWLFKNIFIKNMTLS